MSRSAALPGLAALLALTGCFQVTLECRITCKSNSDCPSDLVCITQQGLCASPAVSMCETSGPDAGPGSPPPSLCINGNPNCLPLPDAVRANLVLLLWPSNLPAVGEPVKTWVDQSGHHNDAQALYPSALPHVIANGVQLDANQVGSGFGVNNSSSLDLGSGDFTVIVVAGLASSTQNATLFVKSDRARVDSRMVALGWLLSSPTTGGPLAYVDDTKLISPIDTPQPSVDVYAIRRATDHVELRLRGTVLASADLAPGTSTTNSENVLLGTSSLDTAAVDSIEAVIVIKGSISAGDLDDLETFLRNLTLPG
jgi:hypothetical protein